jgi:phenylpropionate dioxygenase-like ring-hydroxylating dioxygenase large terminal subunit
VTPETVQFYQEIPLGLNRTMIRGAVYRHASETRALRLARYLAQRIDLQTYREDVQLSEWSNESMKSRAFEGFHLSDLECGVKSHHDHIRAVLPVARLLKRPPEDRIGDLNAELRASAT